MQEQDPDFAASHILTGEAQDGLGRTGEAIAEFQAAAKVAPYEPNVHFGIGYLYWKEHKCSRTRATRTCTSTASSTTPPAAVACTRRGGRFSRWTTPATSSGTRPACKARRCSPQSSSRSRSAAKR